MTEYPTDFFLPKELQRATVDAMESVSDLLEEFASRAGDAGMPEDQATTVVVDVLVKAAAMYAIIVRVEMLEGDPDQNRWRAVTDDAFKWAVDNYRNFKIEEIIRHVRNPADPQKPADCGEGIDRPGHVKSSDVSMARENETREWPGFPTGSAKPEPLNGTSKTSMPEPVPPSTPGDDSAHPVEGTQKSDMVERIARVIDPIAYGRIDEETGAEKSRLEVRRQQAEGLARRVLEAMREPTQLMLDVGDAYADDGWGGETTWRALIDAALGN